MISRSNPPTSRFLQLMVGLSLALPGMAQADINVWYQMISSSGPFGDGIAAVQQGVSGAPLVITTDTVAGGYDFTIRMFANMPAAEAIRAYGVDILAPNDASVSVTSLSYLGPFDQNNAIQIGSGPGAIATDAGQSNMTGSPGQAGLTMMFDCVVHLSEPPTADLELFSGIGASTWLPSSLFPLNIVFADAAPLAGATAGGVSSTPSIVFVPDPTGGGGLDCNNNGIPDDQEIAGDPSIDCNLNTIPDDCDIADQTSNDCQGDGIPDECQLDSGGGGLFSEDFDDINTLQSAGWVALNNSQPVGMTAWDQGNDSNFPPHLGGPGAYISANFENAGEPPPATISNWLMTPQLLLVDGRVLTFFTRTIAGSGFPDRLEVRMSLAGFSADVGATATSVGDFTTMLLSINPSLIVGGYPEAWTQFQVVLSGIGTPTEGRLAFRYFVDNSGPQGDNGNIIGIDTIRLTGILDNDLNGNGIPDECEADCNGNSITDFQDIADGTSQDCNTNGIPDECDITDGTSLDCNSNTIPDECDITDGTSLDDNANGIPDECEVLDCNGNGTPDDQDIADGTSLDCNTNGIPDECDITDGTSLDCNTNNVPDECETDCDGNGIPDDCDITADPTIDLNGNGIPDACEIVDCNGNSIPDLQEILDGTTPDCNGNGIPDDCDIDPTDPDGDGQISPDCNANSVPDSCDITDGISLDCNTNGIPDDCETDCDGNGIPDECDIAADPTIDMDGNGIPDVCESGADCNGNGTPDDQDISDGTSQDCNTNGIPDECDITDGTSQDCDGNKIPDDCDIAADPTIDMDGNGIPDSCESGVDCNGNGTPDDQDISGGTSQDCNTNGIPDECDITDGTSLDCNANKIPDDCDIAADPTIDMDGNGIPDSCESGADCNGNGTPDDQDISDGTSQDCNTNGIPDECDITDGTSLDCNANKIPDDCDIAADPTIDMDGNGVPDVCDNAGIVDCNANSIADDQDIADGTSQDCNANGIPDDCDIDSADPDGDGVTSNDCQGDGIPDECQIGQTSETLFTEDFDDVSTLSDNDWLLINISDPMGDQLWGQGVTDDFSAHMGEPTAYVAANFDSAGTPAPATISNWLVIPEMTLEDGLTFSFYSRDATDNTFPDRLEVRMSLAGPSMDVGSDATSVGDFTALLLEINPLQEIGGYPEEWTLFEVVLTGIGTPTNGRLAFRYFVEDGGPEGLNSNFIGVDTVRLTRVVNQDANGNGIPDECDVVVVDCNNNGFADDQDIADGTSPDCNNNGVPDDCDLTAGTSLDCNENKIPDECETDCNANGIPDDCDIATDPSLDADGNMVPDSCEITDCDGNGISDEQDIATGTRQDCNENGVPDMCDIDNGTSQDANSDGILDECATTTPQPEPPPDGNDLFSPIRSFLAFFLNVPTETNEPISSVPARALGVLGAPMSIALMFLEWLNLPIRLLLFQIISAIFGGA